MCHRSRLICGAAPTAINDTVAQTHREEGRAAVSSACELLSRSAEHSGTTGAGIGPVACVMGRDKREREGGVGGGGAREGKMSLRTHHDVQRTRRSESFNLTEGLQAK